MDLRNKWKVLKTEKDFKLTEESNKIDWTSSSSGDDIPQNQSKNPSKKRKPNKKWKFKHEAKKLKFEETSDEIRKLIRSGSLERELDEILLSPFQDTPRTPSPILCRTLSPILNVTKTPTNVTPSCSFTSPILLSKNQKKRRNRNPRKLVDESLIMLNDAQVHLDHSKSIFESNSEIPASPVLWRLESSEVMFTEATEVSTVEESEELIRQQKKLQEEQKASRSLEASKVMFTEALDSTSPVLLSLAASNVTFTEALEEATVKESEDFIRQRSKLQEEQKGSMSLEISGVIFTEALGDSTVGERGHLIRQQNRLQEDQKNLRPSEASDVMFTEDLDEIIIEESEELISGQEGKREESENNLNQTSPVLLRLETSKVMLTEEFKEVLIEESEDLISQQSKIQGVQVEASDLTSSIQESEILLEEIEEDLENSEEFTLEEVIVEETEDCDAPIENSPDILTPSTTHTTQISISVLSTQTSDEISISSPPIPEINTEAFVDFSQKNKHGKRKSKKRPPKIGSESYKLHELLRKQKSDVAFWKHERFLNVKSDIIDGGLILKGCVQKFWNEYNKVLILCKLDNEDGIVLVIINQALGKTLQDNVWLTIYPPYIRRKLLMNNIYYDSLLNVNKIIIEKYF